MRRRAECQSVSLAASERQRRLRERLYCLLCVAGIGLLVTGVAHLASDHRHDRSDGVVNAVVAVRV